MREEASGELVYASMRCPACNSAGRWRRGVNFEHERICTKCDPCIVWEPGEMVDIPAKTKKGKSDK